MKFLKSLFRKEPHNEEEIIETVKDLFPNREEIISNIDLEDTPEVKPYTKKEPSSKLKNLLLLDDYVAIESIYKINLDNIKTQKNKNPYKDFNVFGCFGEISGRKALKLISKYKIDYAILDLTLSESVYYNKENVTIYLDGVDIASELYKRNPDVKIMFLTAHNLNLRYDYFQNYSEKFNKVSGGKNIVDHYINKISDDIGHIFFKFLYGGR